MTIMMTVFLIIKVQVYSTLTSPYNTIFKTVNLKPYNGNNLNLFFEVDYFITGIVAELATRPAA